MILKRFFLFTLLISSSLFGQANDPEEVMYPSNEFTIQITKCPNRTVTFELTPIGANWGRVPGIGNYALVNDDNTYISQLIAGSEGFVDSEYNGFNYRWFGEGNETKFGSFSQPTAGLKPIRNGFYRLNIIENGVIVNHIFLDWRDAGFTNGSNCDGNDMAIRYNGTTQEILFWDTRGRPNYINDYIRILEEGEIIAYGAEKCTPRDFTPFWSEGLLSIPKKNPSSNIYEPVLVWGPYDGFEPLGYKIYWRRGGSGEFSLLATLDANTFIYRHEGWTFGGSVAEYKVMAFNSTQVSPMTNIERIHISSHLKEFYAAGEKGNNLCQTFALSQNYPNPFNPSTVIEFSLPRKEHVRLKVYDVLGKEVITLVDGIREEGEHSAIWNGINFKGESLSSGIYFYRIEAGSYLSAKKMILQK